MAETIAERIKSLTQRAALLSADLLVLKGLMADADRPCTALDLKAQPGRVAVDLSGDLWRWDPETKESQWLSTETDEWVPMVDDGLDPDDWATVFLYKEGSHWATDEELAEAEL